MSPSATNTDATPSTARATTRQMVLVAVWLALLTGALVGMVVARAPQMSPFDEGTHADYAYQVAHGHLPHAGSLGAVEISREAACHGVLIPTRTPLPPCGTPNPPVGENYNFGHPPLYYAVTGTIAAAVDAVVPGRNFVTAGRLVGVFWLWAGAMVLFFAIHAFGVPWRFAAVAASMLPLVPGVLYASSTITNDAAAALSGGMALFLLARVLVQGRTGWVLPIVVAFGVAATKVLNALPLLVVAVVLSALALVFRRRDGNWTQALPLLRVAVAVGVGVLVLYEGWALLQAGRAAPGWVSPIAGVHGRPITGRPLDEILSTSLTGFNVIAGYFLPNSLDGHALVLWSRALNIAVLAAPLMVLVSWPRQTPSRIVGAATLGGLAAYPLIVELQIYLSSRLYFSALNPRYGLSLVPCVIACIALVAWRRDAFRTMVATLCVGVVAVFTAVGGLLD